MARYDIDISGHQALSVGSMDIAAFQFVVAMSKEVRRALIGEYAVPEHKIRNMFVVDPIGTDVGEYLECSDAISRGLKRLSF